MDIEQYGMQPAMGSTWSWEGGSERPAKSCDMVFLDMFANSLKLSQRKGSGKE